MKIKRCSFLSFVCALVCILLCAGCAATLSRAAISGDLPEINRLLQKGENVNGYDKWGWTPLLWAVYYNYPGVVRFLVERGADPNARTHERYGSIAVGSTPLIVAAYYGYAETVWFLLEHNADRNATNMRGETALMLAKQGNFTQVVELLERGWQSSP
jgi:uncharacterized protein